MFNGISVSTEFFLRGQNNSSYLESSMWSFDNLSFKLDFDKIFFFIVSRCLTKKFTMVFLIPISSLGWCFLISSNNCFAISVLGSNFKIFFNWDETFCWFIVALVSLTLGSSFLLKFNFEFPFFVSLLRFDTKWEWTEEFNDFYLNGLFVLVWFSLLRLSFFYKGWFKLKVWECREEEWGFVALFLRELFIKLTSCLFFHE